MKADEYPTRKIIERLLISEDIEDYGNDRTDRYDMSQNNSITLAVEKALVETQQSRYRFCIPLARRFVLQALATPLNCAIYTCEKLGEVTSRTLSWSIYYPNPNPKLPA